MTPDRTADSLVAALERLAGPPMKEIVSAKPEDGRFADSAWSQGAFSLLKQWYLLCSRQIGAAVESWPGLEPRAKRRAAFWARVWLDALAPSNFFWTNPVAQRKALETRGESLLKAFSIMAGDLAAGTVRMTGAEDFAVGRNLATTPGAVVYRNRLLELIHYRPSAAKVRPVPVVLVTPWINKFYVLDLDAKKSMVKHLLDRGFDVYITSWRNPAAGMAEIGFDDYLTEGIAEAVRVARAVSGAKQVHAAGYCIGGILLSVYMAWLARKHPDPRKSPVAHWTLLASLMDFDAPGDIEVFIDGPTVDWLAALMRAQGGLEGAQMAAAFRLLRANSLVWHYVVHGWLCGERPPASDILYWNMDTTRMPARMHEYYLREMYLANNLAKPGALTFAGETIDVTQIAQPLYYVGAEDDHITPWREVYRIGGHVGGARFALTSSGHILGIVNPPVNPPRRKYRVAAADGGMTADAWREATPEQAGSWWDDWTAWLAERCGAPGAPPPLDSPAHRALADAPGSYVLER